MNNHTVNPKIYKVTNIKNGATHFMGSDNNKCDCGLEFNPKQHEREEYHPNEDTITCTRCRGINNKICDFFNGID